MKRQSAVSAGLLAALALMLASGAATAAPPDLTAGGTPDNTRTINLGPTGMRGWVYHVNSGGRRADTGDARQILVSSVAVGSPAAGILAANDVILGADGTGANPVNFTSDARRNLAHAIAAAEARTPAALRLLRWRGGTTTTVTVILQTMGDYSATAPFNCPKSALILQQGVQAIMAGETAGRYSFGTLSLLAANTPSDPGNAARMTRAQTEARALIPNAATMAQLMSDERDATSMITWQRGHTLIVLAEYFLATGDAQVLPAIEAYAVNIARNQSLFGTMGHIYAEKNPDGSPNGPMGGVYGPVNSAGMPCFLGILLAKECGISHPTLPAAIDRMSRFYAYYVGKGTVPYGEHEPAWDGHENNGKSGLAALCFTLQGTRADEAKYYAKMATAAGAERELGHTGVFFNYVWAPLGAACGGEEAAASHFSRVSWMFDLNRRWDGRFDYDCLNGEGPDSGSQYNDFRMSTAALLTYALPLRKLRITGKSHDPSRWLAGAEVAEAAAVDGYTAALRTTNQLIADLGSWSPAVQRRAANQLATRTIDSATLAQLTSLANDPSGSSRVGACLTLGKISNTSTANARAATLAALLTDPQNHVRFMAAEGMRYLPQTAKTTQLNAILAAAASTAKPLYPFDDEDPLHFAHGRLAMLLFYGGNAYGPKGVIYNNLTGVDRNLLYPAIRAVAANPIGQARSCLYHAYLQLTAADVNALADTLVESVRFRAPSDKMFSAGIRNGGIQALEKYNIAEGVPLSIIFMVDDGRGDDAYTPALAVLKKYAGSSTTVMPDPDVIGFCQSLLGGSHAAAAQGVLDAIAAETNPAPLTPFKSIQSVTTGAASLNLPANQTTLRVTASDLAQGDAVFTWRKVHGAGNVTFTPNGTAAAGNPGIQFDNAPGKYLFEVKMSDSRGLTEVYRTVAVALRNPDGTLPPNDPPTADSQAVTANPASVTPLTLTGTDPEGNPLGFSVTSQPAHGTLSGTAPNLTYTSSTGYLGPDSFTFQVMDSDGQVASATINITVNAAGVRLYAYENFDYAPVNDETLGRVQGKTGGTGWGGPWVDSTLDSAGYLFVYDERGALPGLYGGSYGGGNPTWDGVVDNLPRTGGYAGLSTWSNQAANQGRLNSYRRLATSVGATAADNGGVVWASMVVHFPNNAYYTAPGLMFTTSDSYLRERGRWLTTGGSGIGVALGNNLINNDLNPLFIFGNGSQVLTPGTTLSTSKDNLIVLKFKFGPTQDTVSAWNFTENQSMTEADFIANAFSATSSIDEFTLNTLTIALDRQENAIDEIRIGNSFASVIGVEGTPIDNTPPTLLAIADDRGGETMQQGEPVTYTLTFSEAMEAITIGSSDFGNAGTSSILINSVSQSVPGVVTVRVTPVTPGTLQFQIRQVAVLADLAGNPLNTTAAITDDTVITVNPAMIDVPFVVGMPLPAAETAITATGLAVGSVIYQNNENIGAGSVINQDPSGGSSLAYGSAVDLIVALGDTTPPTPDPMTFSVAPHATGYDRIAMTATTATDASGVEYFFDCVAGGGHDSGWQDSPIYEDGGLNPDTQSTYTVAARDKSVVPNSTQPSAPASATTLPVQSSDGNWIFDGSDTWSNSARWAGGNIADGAGATASFILNLAGNLTVTLDTDRTIGHLTKTDTVPSSHTLTIGGSSAILTFAVGSGTPIITNTDAGQARRIIISSPIAGSDGLTIAGGGMVQLSSTSSIYTGATQVLNNSFLDLGGIANANIGGGAAGGRNITVGAGSTVRFNVLSGGLLNRIVETTDEITIMSGSLSSGNLDFSGGTGADLPNAFFGNWSSNGAKMDISNTATITPAADHYRFGSPNSSGLLGIAIPLGGNQGLIAGGNRVILTAANTFGGETSVRNGGRLVLGDTLALQHSVLATGTPSHTGLLSLSDGTGGGGNAAIGAKSTPNPVIGGLAGSRNLASMIQQGGATATTDGNAGNNTGTLALDSITGITLNPGAGRSISYSGAIGNITGSTTAFTLTKTGLGTQILNGANTYTGATTIRRGTLALGVGGTVNNSSSMTIAAGGTLDTSAKSSYVIPGGQPLTIGMDADDGGGSVIANELDITNAVVSFAIPSTLDDPVYVLATYTSLVGAGFAAVDAPPSGYTLKYDYQGNKIALVAVVGDSPYDTWSGGAPVDEDSNGDGVVNGLAWALGAADPNTHASALLPSLDVASDPDYMIFAFSRNLAAGNDPKTSILVEYGSDLLGWTVAEHDGDHVIITTSPGGTADAVEVKLKCSALEANDRLFVRLKVVVVP